MAEAQSDWLADTRARHGEQLKSIELLRSPEHLNDEALKALDSTLKKLTAFMKKCKGIGTISSASSLLPELDKLNVSKFLDEIATNICEAKIKISDVPSLVEFCVRLASLYEAFSPILLSELRKNLPVKKTDTIGNASKLRVDIKFLTDLCLHGILAEQGVKLLGSVLAYLVNTDKTEHTNVSILMPFCRSQHFDITGSLPLSQTGLKSTLDISTLISSVFTAEQRSALANLFSSYFNSLAEHLKRVKLEMQSLHKSIARQERTRGDASAEDRLKLEQLKTVHDKLAQNTGDLSECLGIEVPPMPEALPSDDEEEEAAGPEKGDPSAGKLVSVWPDADMRDFYERLVNVRRFVRLPSEVGTEERSDEKESSRGDEADIDEQEINADIDTVDVSGLEEELVAPEGLDEDGEADGERAETPKEDGGEAAENAGSPEPAPGTSTAPTVPQEDDSMFAEMLLSQVQPATNMKEFLKRMTASMNREFIDQLAVDFLTRFNTKAGKKRLVIHLLDPPKDRLDLLPFYGRFLATIKQALPDVTKQVWVGLLARFRELIRKPDVHPPEEKKSAAGAAKKATGRTDEKVHLSRYLAELTKFALLPKAEALACLRSLVVDLRSFKVDMMSAMVESMGFYLLKSPKSGDKMQVIVDVMRRKSEKIKDPRQKILLDIAYCAVYPPEKEPIEAHPLEPLKVFLQSRLTSCKCLSKFRKINWDDEEIADYTLKLFCNPTAVRFEELEKLASLVGSLSKHHDWIGIRVADEILEFIRLSIEVGYSNFQQRTLSSVVYLGQLYNYNVCNSTTVLRVLYQLISFGLPPPDQPPTTGVLVRRMQRTRLALQLANVVGEFFVKGVPKKRMDCFLYYLLLFHYETTGKWINFEEQLGDYPSDVADSVDELLMNWRKEGRKHFPKSCEQAMECIAKVEKPLRLKAEEMMRHGGTMHKMDDQEDVQRKARLDRIAEEGDEGNEESEPYQEMSQPSVDSNPEMTSDFADGEEKIAVHDVKTEEDLKADEDFTKDFDRLMMETMKSAPVTHHGPVDLEVPPVAKQKFEKKISFAPGTEGQSEEVPTTEQRVKIALMTRGKDHRPELKPVELETSESMIESWRQHKQKNEDERLRLKMATLKMSGQPMKKKKKKPTPT